MRGDRPQCPEVGLDLDQFTPHARGSTFLPWSTQVKKVVYPACAGIDRSLIECFCVCLSLPRMRGDRPQEVNS